MQSRSVPKSTAVCHDWWFLSSVCAIPGLHGPDREPRAEHGKAGEGCAGGDPRPVHLLHEEPRHQAQPGTTALHPAGTHPPHADLSSPFVLLAPDWRFRGMRMMLSLPWNSGSCSPGGRTGGGGMKSSRRCVRTFW